MPKYIELANEKGIVAVSSRDYKWCMLHKWRLVNKTACTTIGDATVSIGRYILRIKTPYQKVYYKDLDRLNCVRGNLTTIRPDGINEISKTK